jgi:hypothetical protein
MGDARWLVEYGDLAIECGDEADAKKLKRIPVILKHSLRERNSWRIRLGLVVG